MATVKHFIANNTDWCRRLSNSVVGKRALEALQARRKTLLGDPRITAMAERVVTACVRMGFYAPSWRDMPELLERMGEHETVAYRVAAEGIVLLRNEKNALPADVDEGATILVTGNQAVRTPISGKGAAYVKGYNQTSFFEAVNAAADIIFGHTTPSGKLPFTIECDFADSPAAGNRPGSTGLRSNSKASKSSFSRPVSRARSPCT